MKTPLTGIHHVTAMSSDPQQTVDFYADVLGLRLIKQTINFDDPSTYHLYFGDESGRPGTILTFFPWLHIRRGREGSGQVSAITFAVPAGALPYWTARLDSYGLRFSDPAPRFEQQVVQFYDPSGLLLELETQPDVASKPYWHGGEVPAEAAIREIAGITITVARRELTAALLTEVLGFRQLASEDTRTRYATADGGSSTLVDLLHRPDLPYGMLGAGSVHHVAWRVPDDAQQAAWREALTDAGVAVTPVRDRQYFHSIYFQEPGGVLFEIATDTPGFTLDEPLDALGSSLKLPPWLEPQRGSIERNLPPIQVPQVPRAKEV